MKIARLTRQARGGGGADCEMRASKQVNTNGKVNKPKRVKGRKKLRRRERWCGVVEGGLCIKAL